MRLVDADALIHELNKSHYPGAPYIDAGISIAIGKVCDAPTIEPERENGEWEEIEVIADAYDISGVKTWASKMKCNQCGFTTIAIEGHFSQYNFCPNCCADMR